MAAPYYTIRTDVDAAIYALANMELGLKRMARGDYRRDVVPPLVAEAHALADSVYEDDASPDGTPWVDVQKPTGEILEETLTMRRSLSAERGPYKPDGFYIVLEYGDIKARWHHYGTKVGGPISDAERRPFHPKRLRRGKFENIRASSLFDRVSGDFGQDERWHIPPRPLLPIDDIDAPEWVAHLEALWYERFIVWMTINVAF